MPRRDGTGPMGAGAKTGRGLGRCTGVNEETYGMGRGRGQGLGFAGKRGAGRGFGRGAGRGQGRGFGRGMTADRKEI